MMIDAIVNQLKPQLRQLITEVVQDELRRFDDDRIEKLKTEIMSSIGSAELAIRDSIGKNLDMLNDIKATLDNVDNRCESIQDDTQQLAAKVIE